MRVIVTRVAWWSGRTSSGARICSGAHSHCKNVDRRKRKAGGTVPWVSWKSGRAAGESPSLGIWSKSRQRKLPDPEAEDGQRRKAGSWKSGSVSRCCPACTRIASVFLALSFVGCFIYFSPYLPFAAWDPRSCFISDQREEGSERCSSLLTPGRWFEVVWN